MGTDAFSTRFALDYALVVIPFEMIGETVQQYKVISRLGSGGMGTVYLALDTRLNRRAALKFLPHGLLMDTGALARFQREARSAAALNHPNVVTVYEVGEHKGTPYIAMEYVEGRSLDQYREEPDRSVGEILGLAVGLVQGLRKAHEAGIIHRDLKPSNIIVDSDGRPRIVDFGIAKAKEGEDVTGTGITVGTLAFMAPEQIEGLKVDQRCDLWSLGVLLYELLAGERPFKGVRAAALCYAILKMKPIALRTLRPDIPAALDAIISRCLEKDPARRYQSAAQLEADLLAIPEAATAVAATRRRGYVHKNTGKIVVRLFLVAMGVAIVFLGIRAVLPVLSVQSRPVSPQASTLAILPIRNLGPAESAQYTEGLTDDLIAQASKISGLRVISRLSIDPLRENSVSPQEIANRLNAGAILEGGMSWTEGRFRATFTLMRPGDHTVVWAETYSGQWSDYFAAQEDIVRRVAASLAVPLQAQEDEYLAAVPTKSTEAYTRCLKGREYYNRYTHDDNEYAISLFRSALDADSLYSDASAGLADAYSQRALRFGFSKEWHDSAIAVCMRTLRFDSRNPAVYKALGLAYLGKGQYHESLRANQDALRLSPSYYPACTNAGMVSLLIGDPSQALHYHLKATALAPTQGLVAAYVANDFALLGMDQCAELWFDRSLEIQPDLPAAIGLRAYWHLSRGDGKSALADCERALSKDTTYLNLTLAGDAALILGDQESARRFYELANSHVPDFASRSSIPLAHVMLKSGEFDSAQTILDRCLEIDMASISKGNESFEPRHRMATAYLLKGNLEMALASYQLAIDHGWRNYRLDLSNPLFETLRNNSQFRDHIQFLSGQLDSMSRDLAQDTCDPSV